MSTGTPRALCLHKSQKSKLEQHALRTTAAIVYEHRSLMVVLRGQLRSAVARGCERQGAAEPRFHAAPQARGTAGVIGLMHLAFYILCI